MNGVRELAAKVAKASGKLALAEAWGRLHPKTVREVKALLTDALETIESMDNAKN